MFPCNRTVIVEVCVDTYSEISRKKKPTDVQANKQVNRQTDKQTNKQKTEQINKQTIKPCKIKGNAESVRAKNLYEL